ncbi:MAG: hypothetical protein AVDCRST_MAG78-580, partial [uncultured Rubrobacteraceae bacterium]
GEVGGYGGDDGGSAGARQSGSGAGGRDGNGGDGEAGRHDLPVRHPRCNRRSVGGLLRAKQQRNGLGRLRRSAGHRLRHPRTRVRARPDRGRSASRGGHLGRAGASI